MLVADASDVNEEVIVCEGDPEGVCALENVIDDVADADDEGALVVGAVDVPEPDTEAVAVSVRGGVAVCVIVLVGDIV